jgi:flavodoxin
MKKIIGLLAVLFTVFAVGCSSAGSQSASKSEPAKAAPAASAAKQGEVAVVYYSATGNTRKLATTAAKALKADLIEIKPAQPYTDADLDYNNPESRVSKEHKDSKIRPAVANQTDLSKYKAVVVAYPIWWGEAPAVVYTFVENANLSGKNVGAICTAYSSQIGDSGENVAKAAGAKYVGGQRFSPSASEEEIQKFFSGKL